MRRLLFRILLLGVAFLVVTTYVPGIALTGSALSAFWAAAIFVLLNLLITPIVWLAKLIAFPLTLLTLGLMSLVISFAFNVFIFWLMSRMNWGVRVDNEMALLKGTLLLSVISVLLNLLVAPRARPEAR